MTQLSLQTWPSRNAWISPAGRSRRFPPRRRCALSAPLICCDPRPGAFAPCETAHADAGRAARRQRKRALPRGGIP